MAVHGEGGVPEGGDGMTVRSRCVNGTLIDGDGAPVPASIPGDFDIYLRMNYIALLPRFDLTNGFVHPENA